MFNIRRHGFVSVIQAFVELYLNYVVYIKDYPGFKQIKKKNTFSCINLRTVRQRGALMTCDWQHCVCYNLPSKLKLWATFTDLQLRH